MLAVLSRPFVLATTRRSIRRYSDVTSHLYVDRPSLVIPLNHHRCPMKTIRFGNYPRHYRFPCVSIAIHSWPLITVSMQRASKTHLITGTFAFWEISKIRSKEVLGTLNIWDNSRTIRLVADGKPRGNPFERINHVQTRRFQNACVVAIQAISLIMTGYARRYTNFSVTRASRKRAAKLSTVEQGPSVVRSVISIAVCQIYRETKGNVVDEKIREKTTFVVRQEENVSHRTRGREKRREKERRSG